MKYTTEIIINAPIDRVVELFDNPDNLKHWQKGLISFEHVSGEPGQPGAVSRLLFNMQGREIEMIETIITRNLPDEFSGTYTAKGVWNNIQNYLTKVDDNSTRWVMHNEFKFKGLMAVVCALMPWIFRRQTLDTMKAFKNFVETGASVAP